MDGPRDLKFVSLEEVMPEVDRLLLGHRTVGLWSLGQICNHLSAAFVASVEGTSFRAPWIVRKTIGPLMIRSLLRSRSIPRGIGLPEKYRPRPGLDAKAEAEALRAAIRLFQGHAGPLAEHPIAGRIGPDSWTRFHVVHCGHHLAFARPEGIGDA